MLKASFIAAILLITSFAQARDFGRDGKIRPPTFPACVSHPAAIKNHKNVNLRITNMGGYESFIGQWRGNLRKGIMSVPVTIHIFHLSNRFVLRMQWQEIFKSKSQDHSFDVCAPAQAAGNALYLYMHDTPFGPKTPYGLAGLRFFKIVGNTRDGLNLDLSPDELDKKNAKTDLVIRGIKKVPSKRR